MHRMLTIAIKDLRLGLRDRSLILVALLAPVVLAVVSSLAFGAFPSPGTHPAQLALANGDSGAVGRSVEAALAGPEFAQVIRLHAVASADLARQAVADGTDVGALIIPAGFSAAVVAGRRPSLIVVRDANQVVGGAVAQAIASAVAAQIAADQTAVRTALVFRPGGDVAALQSAAAAMRPLLDLTMLDVARKKVKVASYFGPSMAILFVFFTVSLGTRTIWLERKQGILARLELAPVRPWEIVGGKLAAAFVIGTTSMLVMWAVTSIGFRAPWGAPAAVVVLVIATVLASLGVAMLVVAWARTEQQLGALTALVGFGMAIVGGNFIQVYLLPPGLQTVSALTPNGWALRGFADLVATGGGLTTVTTPVFALLAFAVVTAGVAVLGLRRSGLATA